MVHSIKQIVRIFLVCKMQKRESFKRLETEHTILFEIIIRIAVYNLHSHSLKSQNVILESILNTTFR